MMQNSLQRSVLFMPGDDPHKIAKAGALPADAIVLDLEDGVAFNHKDVARQVTAQALQTIDFGYRQRWVRLNPPTQAEDIAATLPARPHGYMLPKVESAAQVQSLNELLTEMEVTLALPNGSVRLIAVIETALGVMNLKEIATASPRLSGLLFGAEDLAGTIGAIRTKQSWEVFYARSAVVTAAAAYGLTAIDQVFFDLHDEGGLIEETRLARQLGYTGKSAIHPRQLLTINELFTPSNDEVEQAKQLLQAYQAAQQAGVGAFAFQGKMVDRPIIRAAERLLAQWQLITKQTQE